MLPAGFVDKAVEQSKVWMRQEGSLRQAFSGQGHGTYIAIVTELCPSGLGSMPYHNDDGRVSDVRANLEYNRKRPRPQIVGSMSEALVRPKRHGMGSLAGIGSTPAARLRAEKLPVACETVADKKVSTTLFPEAG